MTKREAKRQCMRLIQQWQKQLGLQHWRIAFHFGCEEDNPELKDCIAATTLSREHHSAVLFMAQRASPKYYALHICHELQHLLHADLEAGIDVLPEPARAVMRGLLHGSIIRLACALTDIPYQPWLSEEYLPNPPWVTNDR